MKATWRRGGTWPIAGDFVLERRVGPYPYVLAGWIPCAWGFYGDRLVAREAACALSSEYPDERYRLRRLEAL